MKSIALTCVALVLTSIRTASSDIVTFTSRSAFDAAVSGQTMINFNAQNTIGPDWYSYYPIGLTLRPMKFTQADLALYVVGQYYYATSGLSSSYLHRGFGLKDIVSTFSVDVYSVGLDVGQLFPDTGPIGTLYLELSSGETITVTGLQQLGASSNTPKFVGFTSSEAIHSISFDDPSGRTVIDNFAYSTQKIIVPEPASLAIAGIFGLAPLVIFRNRRH